MISKDILETIYDAAYMQRWNDQIRSVEFTELDKQAHKMIIAYFLGKFQEEKEEINWIEIIEGGIFEFLQRVIITDLKPPIFYEIKKNQEKYEELKKYVNREISPAISPLDDGFCKKFQNYFHNDYDTITGARLC